MKITLVTHSVYPESIGGREKYVYYLADALGKRGHDVKVLTCTSGLHARIKNYENFSVHYYPSFDIPLKNARYRIPIGMSLMLLQDDADVIHAQDIHHFTTFASSLATRIRRKPFVVTEHGYPPLGGLMKVLIKVYDATLLKLIGKSSSRIIAVSDFIADELKWRYNLDERKIIKLNNGMYEIDTRGGKIFVKKHSLENKRIILGIGRQTKEKGFQYLIEAFRKISKEFPNAVLVIIGPLSSYNTYLQGLAKNLGLSERIIFTGPVSEEALKSAMKNSEIVVIPSEYDPFPFVALESLSYGKPVVASDVGGLKEIFAHNVNGLLFKSRNSEDLASKMELLLRDKRLRKRLERNSRKSLQRFNWGNFVDEMESIYEKCASN